VRLNLVVFDPLIRIDSQEATDQVFHFFRNVFPLFLFELKLARFDHFKELELVFAQERRLATADDEEDNAHAPEITALIVRLLGDNFWGYVTWGPADSLSKLTLTDFSGHSEVGNLHRSIL